MSRLRFYVAYIAGLICLYTGLSYVLGLKSALLLFGAIHGGCFLLLRVWCWRELRAAWSLADTGGPAVGDTLIIDGHPGGQEPGRGPVDDAVSAEAGADPGSAGAD